MRNRQGVPERKRLRDRHLLGWHLRLRAQDLRRLPGTVRLAPERLRRDDRLQSLLRRTGVQRGRLLHPPDLRESPGTVRLAPERLRRDDRLQSVRWRTDVLPGGLLHALHLRREL